MDSTQSRDAGHSDPQGELQHLWQMAHTMGNNDYEGPAIERIIQDMKAGKISPQEALSRATAIIDSKNDR